MSAEDDFLVEFVGGDVEGGRSLRRAMEALLDSSSVAPDLQAQIVAVLAGRSSMRNLAGDPELREIADRGIAQLREELDEMTPEERVELVRRSSALAATSDADQR